MEHTAKEWVQMILIILIALFAFYLYIAYIKPEPSHNAPCSNFEGEIYADCMDDYERGHDWRNLP